GRYEILRHLVSWRLAQAAQLPNVPAMVYQLSDKDAADLVHADIQTWDTRRSQHKLDPITEAEELLQAYKAMEGPIRGRLTRLAAIYGVTRGSIWQKLAILGLCENVLKMGRGNKLSTSQLRALVGLQPNDQLSLADKAVNRGLTVKTLAARAGAIKKGLPIPISHSSAAGARSKSDPDVQRLEQSLQEHFGCAVTLTNETLTVDAAGDVQILAGVLEKISNALPKPGCQIIFDSHDLIVHFSHEEARESFLSALRVGQD
ncbi:MAG: ParB/RepB/Spo0J family partition protein, partial [Sulfuricaulis sp.]